MVTFGHVDLAESGIDSLMLETARNEKCPCGTVILMAVLCSTGREWPCDSGYLKRQNWTSNCALHLAYYSDLICPDIFLNLTNDQTCSCFAGIINEILYWLS
jgi:hypothetical protein